MITSHSEKQMDDVTLDTSCVKIENTFSVLIIGASHHKNKEGVGNNDK